MLGGWPVLGVVPSAGLASVVPGSVCGLGLCRSWRVGVMTSMVGAGTTFTLEFILPRVLLVVPVSCQDFSTMSVASWCSIDATSRLAFQWASQQV